MDRYKHNAQLRERYASDASLREKKKLESFLRYCQKRDEVVVHLGGRCYSPTCLWINDDGSKGCTDKRCLQIDHVHGNGAKLRKSARSEHGETFYKKVLKSVPGEDYQLLCANCNWIKRVLNNELPKSKYSMTVAGA
jgi:hypothetical protein